MSEQELDYKTRQKRRLRPALLLLMIGGGLALLLLILVPTLQTSRHGPGYSRLRCASNLRQIGTAFALYATENGGALAPDFATLLQTQDLASDLFVCSSTDDDRSTATQPSMLRADLVHGSGHCSYVFVGGAGKLSEMTGDDVLAYEPLANHQNDRTNVVFADGQVAFVTEKLAKIIVDQHTEGVRPVRLKGR